MAQCIWLDALVWAQKDRVQMECKSFLADLLSVATIVVVMGEVQSRWHGLLNGSG